MRSELLVILWHSFRKLSFEKFQLVRGGWTDERTKGRTDRRIGTSSCKVTKTHLKNWLARKWKQKIKCFYVEECLMESAKKYLIYSHSRCNSFQNGGFWITAAGGKISWRLKRVLGQLGGVEGYMLLAVIKEFWMIRGTGN